MSLPDDIDNPDQETLDLLKAGKKAALKHKKKQSDVLPKEQWMPEQPISSRHKAEKNFQCMSKAGMLMLNQCMLPNHRVTDATLDEEVDLLEEYMGDAEQEYRDNDPLFYKEINGTRYHTPEVKWSTAQKVRNCELESIARVNLLNDLAKEAKLDVKIEQPVAWDKDKKDKLLIVKPDLKNKKKPVVDSEKHMKECVSKFIKVNEYLNRNGFTGSGVIYEYDRTGNTHAINILNGRIVDSMNSNTYAVNENSVRKYIESLLPERGMETIKIIEIIPFKSKKSQGKPIKFSRFKRRFERFKKNKFR